MVLWTFLGTCKRTTKRIESDLEQVPVFHRQTDRNNRAIQRR
jgi:hypothetical protein